MGKAFVFIGAMLVVAFMFSTMGQPGVQTSSDSTSVTWSGGTIFDYWATNAQEKTERVRLEQDGETQRKAIAEQEATLRNRDFWQVFPYVVLALAALAAAVGASCVGVVWAQRKPAPRVTVNMLAAPTDLHQFAAMLGIDNAQFEYTGEWHVVDPVTADRYQPPPRLAQLPGPRGGA
jgi:hypothetical protein